VTPHDAVPPHHPDTAATIAGGADDHEPDAGLRLGVAAALVRIYTADQRMFVERLARMLETALPSAVRVERGGWPWASKTVRRVTIDLGDQRYALAADTTVQASRTLRVRGIALKTEVLPVAQWLADLERAVDAHAGASDESRTALARIVG
jgi:hypothetical protein